MGPVGGNGSLKNGTRLRRGWMEIKNRRAGNSRGGVGVRAPLRNGTLASHVMRPHVLVASRRNWHEQNVAIAGMIKFQPCPRPPAPKDHPWRNARLGVRGFLVYCSDYRCSHSAAIRTPHGGDSRDLGKLLRYAGGREQSSVMGENVIGIVFSVCPVFEIKDTTPPESDCAS
jgi:hypothetical protein